MIRPYSKEKCQVDFLHLQLEVMMYNYEKMPFRRQIREDEAQQNIHWMTQESSAVSA